MRENKAWEQDGDCQAREQGIAVLNRMAKKGLNEKTIKSHYSIICDKDKYWQQPRYPSLWDWLNILCIYIVKCCTTICLTYTEWSPKISEVIETRCRMIHRICYHWCLSHTWYIFLNAWNLSGKIYKKTVNNGCLWSEGWFVDREWGWNFISHFSMCYDVVRISK